MSAPHSDPSEPRRLTDPELIQVHEHIGEEKVDDGGNFKLLPLAMLFLMSGLIFFGGTYLNSFSGFFSATVHDERGSPHAAVVAAKVDPLILGKNLFNANCVACHQATGLGMAGMFPPLAKSDWVNGNEERIIRVVLYGLTGPVTVSGQQFGTQQMPSFASQSNENIAAVLSYIRQEWGNSAPAVSAEKVAEIRTKVGTHGAWTSAELDAFK